MRVQHRDHLARGVEERAEETRIMQERIVANFAATTVSSDEAGGYREIRAHRVSREDLPDPR